MHGLLPVHPIAIADQHCDRRARRLSATDAGKNFGPVTLDRHAAPATVTTLSAPELRVECIDVDVEAGRHPVKRDDQRLPVRFAGAQKPQHPQGIVYEEIAHSRRRSAGFPRSGGASLLAFGGGMVRLDAGSNLTPLLEAIDHGRDGYPRWIVIDS